MQPGAGAFHFTLETAAPEAHAFLLGLGTEAAAQLDAVPQLTGLLPDDAVQYEGGPLHTRKAEAAAHRR